MGEVEGQCVGDAAGSWCVHPTKEGEETRAPHADSMQHTCLGSHTYTHMHARTHACRCACCTWPATTQMRATQLLRRGCGNRWAQMAKRVVWAGECSVRERLLWEQVCAGKGRGALGCGSW